MKRKLKKSVINGLYVFSLLLVIGTVYLLNVYKQDEPETLYVRDVIIKDTLPVVATKAIVIKPYANIEATIGRYYYEKDAASDVQENSLIYYQGVYIPNTGIDYCYGEVFDVIAVLDGQVTNVSENSLLGKIVEITHTNNLITTYQSLGEVLVQKGDTVVQGQAIGKSGESNISTELGNHVHFEMILDGKNVNPDKYYGLEIDKL